MQERTTQRQPRYSLRELLVVVTSIAILANIVTVDVTKSITSIIGLMAAAGLVVAGATYWAWRCNRSSTYRRPIEFAL